MCYILVYFNLFVLTIQLLHSNDCNVVNFTVSVTIFQTFSCHDVGSQDEKEEYMTADYSVSCASERYSFAIGWAIAMIFVYPIGEMTLI